MSPERLKQIEETVSWKHEEACKILMGERDNYDGADGARYIKALCEMCRELIEKVESTPP